MHYREPGTFSDRIEIEEPQAARTGFIAPDVSEPETIHIILTLTDKGSPALSRYARVIVSVLPVDN